MDEIFLSAESDHELGDEVFLGLSKCEFRAASVSYRSESSVQVQNEELILYANGGEDTIKKRHLPSTVSAYAWCSCGHDGVDSDSSVLVEKVVRFHLESECRPPSLWTRPVK